MNKRQKLVQEVFLDDEEAVIKRLKSVYNHSLKDIEQKSKTLQDRINNLQGIIETTTNEKDKAQLLSMQQSKVYQKQYQDALKKQVGSILDNMQVEEFKTISDYLNKCYEQGFYGTMYDMHGQGIPLIMPFDQEAMVMAVQTNSKISQGLYSRLGEDVSILKKKITSQISRGISTGMTYQQMAQQLAGYTNIGFNNAVRIARTEGHRIQVQATMDACYKAKDKGADVVKQWDATLDGKIRTSHRKVDGEIRELDKPFGNGLMFPGDPEGEASEVVNCRCALLQRAKWALDEDELNSLKERAEYYGLEKSDSFEDFKKKYLKTVEETQPLEVKKKKHSKTLENTSKSSTMKGQLTNTDVKAINDYMSSQSYTVNGKLRTGAELSSDEQKFIENLDNALDKMSTYEGNLQRSLYFYSDDEVDSFLSGYKIGEPVIYNEFLSTTKGEIYNPEGQVQIFIQNAKNGRDISSINEKEQEVLYRRGSSFDVINIVEQNGTHFILLGERE